MRTLRRAREINAAANYSLAEWLALLDQFDHRCGYCGAQSKLEPDHRIPLARGGSNWIANVIPVCRSCNTRKRTATEDEFRARLAGQSASAPVARSQDQVVEESAGQDHRGRLNKTEPMTGSVCVSVSYRRSIVWVGFAAL